MRCKDTARARSRRISAIKAMAGVPHLASAFISALEETRRPRVSPLCSVVTCALLFWAGPCSTRVRSLVEWGTAAS